jgi:DNA (cytosine-5)-methyltransferase 1
MGMGERCVGRFAGEEKRFGFNSRQHTRREEKGIHMARTAVSLFAGVGGFDLALERNEIKVVASVEIDQKASAILVKHFPHSKLFGDIQEVTGEELIAAGFNPVGGIITGGFPCQDLSVAGKRAGLTGKRSGLFWQICRLLDETKAENFILENVPGLLSSNDGRDMAIVIKALVELGYRISWRILDAQYFGIPQRRRRVFIVGCLGSSRGKPEEILAIGESRSRYLAESKHKRNKSSNRIEESVGTYLIDGTRVNDVRVTDDGIVPTIVSRWGTGGGNVPAIFPIQGTVIGRADTSGPQGKGFSEDETMFTLTKTDVHAIAFHTKQDPISGSISPVLGVTSEGMGILSNSIVRRLTPIECERLQGFPDNWTDGQADSHRYKQMGNAVAVPVVNWIIQRLVKETQ